MLVTQTLPEIRWLNVSAQSVPEVSGVSGVSGQLIICKGGRLEGNFCLRQWLRHLYDICLVLY